MCHSTPSLTDNHNCSSCLALRPTWSCLSTQVVRVIPHNPPDIITDHGPQVQHWEVRCLTGKLIKPAVLYQPNTEDTLCHMEGYQAFLSRLQTQLYRTRFRQYRPKPSHGLETLRYTTHTTHRNTYSYNENGTSQTAPLLNVCSSRSLLHSSLATAQVPLGPLGYRAALSPSLRPLVPAPWRSLAPQ